MFAKRMIHVLLLLGLMSYAGTGDRMRCGTMKPIWNKNTVVSDCGQNETVVKSDYEPGDLLEIPVVVHILYRADGTGRIDERQVHQQIDILNEDFRAMPGTPGANGFDTHIQFYLAQQDENGNATSGIVYTQNDRWFDDESESVRREFGSALGWDPKRYLNIFVNSGGGAAGYVVNMPWMVGADPSEEGVVVAFDVFGPNDSGYYDLGRTTTHEVGHYLGLEHTFGEGYCDSGDCYRNGDLICDTEMHADPNEECVDDRGCGVADPIRNYMNYTPDSCMREFTREQSNRMRCSLLTFRTQLIDASPSPSAQNRWIPHVTKAGGGFQTRFLFSNSASTQGQLTLHGYDSDGVPLVEKTVTVPGDGLSAADADHLFAGAVPSHVGISGSSSCRVSVAYRAVAGGASAHVLETSTDGQSFMIYLGETERVFDGLALVNLGSETARIDLDLLDESGNQRLSVMLAGELASHSKLLRTFDDFGGHVVARIRSSQPVVLLFLRGTRPGESPAFLYQTTPIALP